MDGTRFDAATKSFANGVSRRVLLKSILGGFAAALTARALPVSACTPPGPLNYCNTDSECCSGSRCINGICQCPTGTKQCGDRCIPSDQTCGPQYCPTGYTQCGTQCIDTSRDRNNCGGCGRVCPSLQICSNGHCCPKGYVYCDGTCRLSTQCTLLT
jgi:hypothetical protein